MRIILFSSFTGLDADDDALVLRMFGYDVATWYDLHKPAYPHNHGCAINDDRAWQNLATELLEGALLVMHKEAKPDEKKRALQLAKCLAVPAVDRHDLCDCVEDMTTEHIDDVNMAQRYPVLEATMVHADGDTTVTKQQGEGRVITMFAPTVKPAVIAYRGELLGTPSTDRIAPEPTHLEALMAEDMSPYEADSVLANLSASIARRISRVLHWIRRRSAAPAQRAALPRPYRLDTAPLSTTG